MNSNNITNLNPFSRVFVSTRLKGKMSGVAVISTSVLQNAFCQYMQQQPGIVCEKCFARNTEKIYPAARERYQQNSAVLSESILTDDELPVINALFCRFNAQGELINKNHVLNLFNICKLNERVTFTLWTKRPDLVDAVIQDGHEKPANLIIIFSGFKVNECNQIPPKYAYFIDKIFNVYTKDFAINNNLNINCGARSCLTCQRCYNLKNTEKVINEILK